MAEPDGVVAPESPFCSSRRNDDGAVDGRIAEKGFARERKWVSKKLGNNRSWKVYIIFRFGGWLHPWRCFGFVCGCTLGSAVVGLRVATLGGGLLGGLVQKKVLRVQIAVVPEVPIS